MLALEVELEPRVATVPDGRVFFFLSLLDSVVYPHWPSSSATSKYVARRPNRGHVGGGAGPLPAVHAYASFYREWVQHFHPRRQ